MQWTPGRHETEGVPYCPSCQPQSCSLFFLCSGIWVRSTFRRCAVISADCCGSFQGAQMEATTVFLHRHLQFPTSTLFLQSKASSWWNCTLFPACGHLSARQDFCTSFSSLPARGRPSMPNGVGLSHWLDMVRCSCWGPTAQQAGGLSGRECFFSSPHVGSDAFQNF